MTKIGKNEIFLGHDWLEKHNPRIHWRQGTIEFNSCPEECGQLVQEISASVTDEKNEEAKMCIPWRYH